MSLGYVGCFDVADEGSDFEGGLRFRRFGAYPLSVGNGA